MPASIVFTFIGSDKPGLIRQLSQTVTDCGGNWLESRMSQLAGQFAGIARVQIEPEQADKLHQALLALSGTDLEISIQTDNAPAAASNCRQLHLSLVGNDRLGIVHELSKALAERNINVSEMNTNVTSAPMTGEPLFEAEAEIQVPASIDLAELSEALEEIADELAVDIQLND